MQLFVKDDLVFAWHEDGQSIPADAYPDTTRIVVPDETVLERICPAPETGESDVRPYAAPDLTLPGILDRAVKGECSDRIKSYAGDWVTEALRRRGEPVRW